MPINQSTLSLSDEARRTTIDEYPIEERREHILDNFST